MAVGVGTAWEDSSRSGLEMGTGEVTAASGIADLGNDEVGIVLMFVGEVEDFSAAESVEAS